MRFLIVIFYLVLSILVWSFSAGQEESIPFPPDGSFRKTSESSERARTLTSIQVTETAQGVNVEIFADGALEFAYYSLPNPARLIFDFKNVRSQLTSRTIQNPYLASIRCFELWRGESRQPAARIVFQLKAHMKFDVSIRESGLLLDLTAIQSESALVQTASRTPGSPESSTSTVSSDMKTETAQTNSEETASTASQGPQTPQTTQRQSAPNIPAVTQAKPVVRLPAGPLDLEPADADPVLFFTVPANSTDYVLGPEDVIELKVLQMNELNVTIRIAGDGAITLPFLGTVPVNGLTADQVSQKITGLLGEQFLQNPQVSVFVKEFNSQKVSIIGSVQTPGTYALTGPRTIIQMLAQAGGVRPDAGKGILVFRQDPKGQSTRLAILRENLLMKGDPVWNIWLRAGDVVNIPPQEMISISLFGAVAAPGVYTLISGSENTLLKAIARAGGLQRASKSGVKIKRRSTSGKETILEVNLNDLLSGKKPDILLQDGDLIIINESFF